MMLTKVRKARREQKITIKEMADYLGFKSASTYCKKEKQEIPITTEEARKICIKLNITPLHFF